MATSLEALQRASTCPKCLNLFSHPKLLPCLHCSCRDCLSVKDGVRESEGLLYLVACPVCDEETELPKSGVASLPDAFFKVRMVEAYSKEMEVRKIASEVDEKDHGCEECGIAEVTATSHCTQCNHFICDSCVEVHRKMKFLSGHEITSLEEYREKQSVLLREKLQRQESELDQPAVAKITVPAGDLHMSCDKHNQPQGLYCKSCSVLICEECSKETHTEPRHKYDSVHTLVRGQKLELKQNVKTMSELGSSLGQAAASAEETASVLTQQQEQIVDMIESSFAELMQELEECKKQILKGVRAEIDSKITRLQERQEEFRRKESSLASLSEVCTEIVQYSTNQELIALRRHFITRTKEVVRHKKDYSPTTFVLQPISLPLPCTDHIMNCVKAHLDSHHEVSMTKTTVEFPCSVKIGEKVRVAIHTKYRSGRSCIERKEVAVEAKVPRSDSKSEVTVALIADLGSYEASFIPDVRGRYEISVKVEGKEIVLSPFHIRVTPKTLEWNWPCRVIANQEWPWGVACLLTGNREIYITRNYNHVIAVVDGDGKQLRTIGRKGQKPGCLWHPTGIALDSHGSIFVADGQENGRLQKLSPNGQLEFVTEVGLLSQLGGVMVSRNDDKVYVCDRKNRRVAVFTKELKLVKTFGELSRSTGEYHELTGSLLAPHSLAQDPSGNIYVTDPDAKCIQVFDEDGGYLRTIEHSQGGEFAPSGILIDRDLMFVADCAENCIVVLHTDGKYVTKFGSYGQQEGQFYTPVGVAMDVDGFLLICDHCNGRIQVF